MSLTGGFVGKGADSGDFHKLQILQQIPQITKSLYICDLWLQNSN